MSHEVRHRALQTAARAKPGPGTLTTICLHIARGEEPDLDVDALTARMAELSERVRSRFGDEGGRPWRAVQKVLSEDEGFAGDETSYGHPDNSYLHRVLDRRRGLPILLSVLWVEVARGAGFSASGVALPGHFIARIGDGNERTFVDPFRGGAPISRDAALRLGAAAAGGGSPDPAWLEPAAPHGIAVRMLNNLVNAYDRTGDAVRMERVLSDQLALCPGDGRLLVRRGDVRAQLGDGTGALLDLNEALVRLEDGPLFRHAHALAARLARTRESFN